jgi:integrase
MARTKKAVYDWKVGRRTFRRKSDAERFAAEHGGTVQPGRTAWKVVIDERGRERTGGTFTRKVDADRAAAAITTDKNRGVWVDPRLGTVTFGEVADRWLASKDDGTMTVASFRRAAWIVGSKDLAPLRTIPVGHITRADIQNLVSRMKRRKLAPATIRKNYNVVSAILTDAVADGLIPASPCIRIDLPRIVERKPRHIEADMIEALADAIDPRYRALIIVGGYCGLRFAETAGLRVDHIDLMRRRITVEDAIVEVGGELHPGSTKNAAFRDFALPQNVADEIAAHLAEWPPGSDGLIFQSPNGGPLRRSSWTQRYFRPAVNTAGLRGFNVHALRHSAASIMGANGAQLHEIGGRLGQRSAQTTRRYAHLVASRDEVIADRLDEAARAARERLSKPSQPASNRPQTGRTVTELDGRRVGNDL